MQKIVSPLWCKNSGKEIIYHSKNFPNAGDSISFRSLDLEKDLSIIHDWVNKDYTRTFWQMRGSVGLLRSCYQCIMQNPFAHSFIGLYNQAIVCQVDLYKVGADEIASHIRAGENDCGFHLLMAPVNKKIHGLTNAIIKTFLTFYFSHPASRAMYGEPDINNLRSIQLLENAGFEKIKTIDMSYKKAHLYSLTRNKFLCNE